MSTLTWCAVWLAHMGAWLMNSHIPRPIAHGNQNLTTLSIASPQNRGTWNWILLKCCFERACSKASIGHTTNKSANRRLLAKNDVIIAEHLLQIGMFSLTSPVFGHYRSRNHKKSMEIPVPRCIATASDIVMHQCISRVQLLLSAISPSPSGE